MDQQPADLLMELSEFRALAHLSLSAERKHRRESDDWAPHLVIGRRVLYRRAGVMDWLERQEAKQGGAR